MEHSNKEMAYLQTTSSVNQSICYIFALTIIAVTVMEALTNRIAKLLILDQSDRR